MTITSERQLETLQRLITLTPRGRQFVLRKEPEHINVNGCTTTRAAFETLIISASDFIQAQRATVDEDRSVRHYLTRYMAEVHGSQDVSSKRITDVGQIVNVLLTMKIADRPIDHITKNDIAGIKKERDMDTSTHRGYATILKGAINQVLDQDGKPNIQFIGRRALPAKGKSLDYEYDFADIDPIFAGMDKCLVDGETPHASGKSNLGILTRLAYVTGQRFHVLRNAKWSSVKKGPGGVLHIYFEEARTSRDGRKTAAKIPVGRDVQKVLDGAVDRRSEYIWGSGPEVSDVIIRDRLNRVVSELGYRNHEGASRQESWHTFRHTRVCHLIDAGVTINDIATMLDDTVETIAKIYAHRKKIKDLADALNRIDLDIPNL